MYKKIMVPVDLVHADKLALALDTAANLAKLYNIPPWSATIRRSISTMRWSRRCTRRAAISW
jgi:hypothetical protein